MSLVMTGKVLKNKAVCRTAPATPGLLKIVEHIIFCMYSPQVKLNVLFVFSIRDVVERKYLY